MKKYPTMMLFLLTFSFVFAQESNRNIIEKAKRIHESVITIDTHNDFSLENFTSEKNYTMNLDTQVNLPKMEKGRMDVSWLIVYTNQGPLTKEGYDKAYAHALKKFEAIHRLVEEYAPKKAALATTSEEVRKIVASGKKAIMIGVENGYPIGMKIERVEEFYNRGARYMSLSHNDHSQLCDSNTGEKDGVWLHFGLSELGEKVVHEMNRLGMMVDISHPSKEAMREILEITKAPVIASHSSARALCNHSRNLDDEQLQWLKNNGGVVQTVAFAAYVDGKKAEAYAEASKALYNKIGQDTGFQVLEWSKVDEMTKTEQKEYFDNYREVKKMAEPKIAELKENAPPVNVSDFVNHIDYLISKIGINHVGISSDFDGGGGVEGWRNASESFNVTLELVRRGYSKEEITKLWGGNLLRVLDEVQAVAQKIQHQKI